MLATAAALGLVLIAADPPQRKTPPGAEELKAITARGRNLAEYDSAAWHASDALQAAKPKTSGLARYIAHKSDKGWVVAFGRLNDNKDKFLIVYEATLGKDPESYDVKALDPPKEDTGFFLAAAKGTDLVLKDFVKHYEGERRPYNAAVLPAEKGGLWVYLVPAATKQGAWPLGGDVRYTVSADGTKIVEKRQLHKAIIEREAPPKDGDEELAMGMHTHVLDDTPEDTDIFHVLVRKPAVPELVVTTQYVFQVDTGGGIKYLGKADEFLKK